MSIRVLIVEDEKDFVDLIRDTAKPLAIEVVSEADGQRGLERALQENFDAVVLDIGLPGCNGLDICKKLRAMKPKIPIIFLSSLNQEAEVVLGLELGADDYVTKPFRPRELLSRLRSLIGRYDRLREQIARESVSSSISPEESSKIYRQGDILVDFFRYELTVAAQRVVLSTQEWIVLEALLQRPGSAVSRDTLIELVWGEYQPEYEQLLTRLLWRVRDKVKPGTQDGQEEGYVLTVRGFGYRWNA